MMLTDFTRGLVEGTGTTVAGQIAEFEDGDIQETADVLRQYYERDILEMPGTAPAFNPEAATWSTQFLYRMIQLMLLRDLGTDKIQELLPVYTMPLSPDVIYSADLVLRHLPDLFRLAKSLSPDDPLVKRLTATAAEWPLSSVGIPLAETAALDVILSHHSLQRAYVDRIIEKKDSGRCNTPAIHALVMEALGHYPGIFWQEYPLLLTNS